MRSVAPARRAQRPHKVPGTETKKVGKRTARSAEKHQRLINQLRDREEQDDRQKRARHVEPRTKNQGHYINSIIENDITFGFGPAGTGKTYLAGGMAARYLSEGAIEKIVICRPAVEANGENLGFLPGDLNEKMDPYLRPIFDAFGKFWPKKQVQNMIYHGQIEVSPLAFMRGRTFSDCFVIADEMQNASRDMVLMLLTRLGENSKMVVTGDPDQRDLKGSDGFEHAQRKLGETPGIGFITFGQTDVVRHPLIGKILSKW